MELRQIRHFLSAAEELNFTRAAERCNIAQPPFSRSIQLLERELGVRLFERSARGVRLTDVGRQFLVSARRIHDDVQRAVDGVRLPEARNAPHLRVGLPQYARNTSVYALLETFTGAYPGSRLDLHEAHSLEQVRMLVAGELDVGFVTVHVQHEALSVACVWQEDVVVVLPDVHPLAACEEVPLALLQDEPVLVPPRGESPEMHDLMMWYVRQACARPVSLQEAYFSVRAVLRLVGAGAGMLLAPASAVAGYVEGTVVRPLQDAPWRVEVALAWRRERPAPFVEEFVRALRAGPAVGARQVVGQH